MFTKRGETYQKIPDQEVVASPLWPKDDRLEHKPVDVEMVSKVHHPPTSAKDTNDIGDFV